MTNLHIFGSIESRDASHRALSFPIPHGRAEREFVE